MPRKIVWFAMLVVLLSRPDFAVAASQSASREPFAVVRVVDPELRLLVLLGQERSATFRQLVEEIQGHDGWCSYKPVDARRRRPSLACCTLPASTKAHHTCASSWRIRGATLTA